MCNKTTETLADTVWGFSLICHRQNIKGNLIFLRTAMFLCLILCCGFIKNECPLFPIIANLKDGPCYFFFGWGGEPVMLSSNFFFRFVLLQYSFQLSLVLFHLCLAVHAFFFSTFAVQNPVNTDYFRKCVYVCRLGVQELFW